MFTDQCCSLEDPGSLMSKNGPLRLSHLNHFIMTEIISKSAPNSVPYWHLTILDIVGSKRGKKVENRVIFKWFFHW